MLYGNPMKFLRTSKLKRLVSVFEMLVATSKYYMPVPLPSHQPLPARSYRIRMLGRENFIFRDVTLIGTIAVVSARRPSESPNALHTNDENTKIQVWLRCGGFLRPAPSLSLRTAHKTWRTTGKGEPDSQVPSSSPLAWESFELPKIYFIIRDEARNRAVLLSLQTRIRAKGSTRS